MPLRPGIHRLDPEQGTIEVRTYREGVAQKAGHDLIIDVRRWQGSAEVTSEGAVSALSLEVDPHSLEVREGLRGVKPLTDRDRAKIREDVEAKVLLGTPIAFRSTALQSADGWLRVRGELTVAGETHPVSYELEITPEGRLRGTLPVTQTEFGIKPYRGFMGALKVRDTVEVKLDAQLPLGA
jgi:polyisoprenoid-binding protein YceI